MDIVSGIQKWGPHPKWGPQPEVPGTSDSEIGLQDDTPAQLRKTASKTPHHQLGGVAPQSPHQLVFRVLDHA